MHGPTETFLLQLSLLVPRGIHLVGGAVRDLLIGIEQLKDIDLVMPAGSAEAARAFAGRISGSYVVLDEERRITRVVKREGSGLYQFDFTDFEGPDLHADLRRRDFTINAMALDLAAYLGTRSLQGLVDPLGGREDLHRKLIRSADPQVLDDDPLRLLRAVRFAATLGFTIERATGEAIRARAHLVTQPAPERIRDELFQVLSPAGAGAHLLLLETLGLLKHLFPELGPLRDFTPGKHHRYDILTHSVRTADHVDTVLGQLQDLAPRHADVVQGHLDEQLEHLISRKAALRFACLLHDIGKAAAYGRGDDGAIHFHGHENVGADLAVQVCRRFRLSKDTETAVRKVIKHHMRPLQLSMPGGPSRRALYRYCRDLGPALPDSIVQSLADAQATSEVMPPEGFTDTQRTAAVILDYYYEKFLKTEAAPLVTGRDLIERGMQPGPRFREILDEFREQQAGGMLRDRAEALAALDRMQ